MKKRTFIFGSEWLYIKIYSGPKTLENIFINRIIPEIHKMLKDESIDYFFFIKYQDPDYHIRLRLHFKYIDNIGKVIISLKDMFEEYITNHVISRVCIDTYNREIERYKESFIEDVERVFFYDSLFITDYLYNNSDDNERWLTSIKYIDLFLEECGLSLDDKIDMCNKSSTSLSNEIYYNTPNINSRLNLKYRNLADKIETALNEHSKNSTNLDMSLNQYLSNIMFFTNKICDAKSGTTISNSFDILSSIIHMHINRMFRTKQRINECVVYYFLLKFYKSKKARIKYTIQI